MSRATNPVQRKDLKRGAGVLGTCLMVLILASVPLCCVGYLVVQVAAGTR